MEFSFYYCPIDRTLYYCPIGRYYPNIVLSLSRSVKMVSMLMLCPVLQYMLMLPLDRKHILVFISWAPHFTNGSELSLLARISDNKEFRWNYRKPIECQEPNLNESHAYSSLLLRTGYRLNLWYVFKTRKKMENIANPKLFWIGAG